MSKNQITIQTLIEEVTDGGLLEYLEKLCHFGVAWEQVTCLAVKLVQVPPGLPALPVNVLELKKIFAIYIEGLIFFSPEMGTTHAQVRVVSMKEKSHTFTCQEVLDEIKRHHQ